MSTVFGYCRISTPKQNIDRQIRNIKHSYPTAVMINEIYTGTKTYGRKEWQKLMKNVRPGDTIVFDSVSRMSRNATEGFECYEELFNRRINLVFLKEPHISTQVYKKALSNQVALTGTKTDIILNAVNCYLLELAREQIIIAFEQAEKEVADLRQRTKEGIETARLNGKQIGRIPGKTYATKKSKEMTDRIKKMSKDFDGIMTDKEVLEVLGIARNTYFKYKRMLKNELI